MFTKMIWKILANVGLNIGIFSMGMSAYWAFKNGVYGMLAASIFSLTLLIFLKVRLIKRVRETAQKK